MAQKQDKPSNFSHPGWRVSYNLITWIILGITISPGNSIFVGLFMLGCGLLFDYAKFSPSTKLRTITKGIGTFIAVVVILLNLVAVFGAVSVDSNLYIKIVSFPFFVGDGFAVKWYWLLSGLTVIWTLVDWASEYVEDLETDKATMSTIQTAVTLETMESGGTRR